MDNYFKELGLWTMFYRGNGYMSNSVNKSDFYYGAFLTKVLDNGDKPTLISKDDGRGIYKLTTNKKDNKDYIVYIKYATNNNKKRTRWAFNYTDNNIDEIKKYIEDGQNIIFAYICAYKNFKNSEVAIAGLKELRKCIDPECEINTVNRVSIYKKPHSPVLRMYGTKRADIKNGEDNTVHLKRTRINEL